MRDILTKYGRRIEEIGVLVLVGLNTWYWLGVSYALNSSVIMNPDTGKFILDPALASHRWVARECLVMPMLTAFIIVAIRAMDRYTPLEWLANALKSEIGAAIIVSVLIYCMAWLSMQS